MKEGLVVEGRVTEEDFVDVLVVGNALKDLDPLVPVAG